MNERTILVLVIMGVSGSGKRRVIAQLCCSFKGSFASGETSPPAHPAGCSTVGAAVAQELGWTYLEGDEFHPHSNIDKMRSGQPLDDKDRRPWLTALSTAIAHHAAQGQPIVLACSALKPEYRSMLIGSQIPLSRVAFVLLEPSEHTLRERLAMRHAGGGHFMPPELLQSQLAALQYREEDLFMHFRGDMQDGKEGTASVDDVAAAIVARLRGKSP